METLDRKHSTTGKEERSAARRRTRRVAAVGAAVAAVVTAWVLIEPVGGIDLRAPAFEGSAEGSDIGLTAVALTGALASLAGWGLLALLERWARRPRRVWAGIAVVAFFVSLSGPMSGTGIPPGDRLLLALLHVTAAAVLIPLMYRSADA